MNDKRKIVLISDFFLKDVIVGGGELNDKELVGLLSQRGYKVEHRQSHKITEDFIESNKDSFYIISNFRNLHFNCISKLMDCEYVIYEHDHKYLKSRNPALYRDFKAPGSDIIWHSFYRDAKKVFCQSEFHKSILERNLSIDNIVNISGNLWSQESLDLIRDISKRHKKQKTAVLRSAAPHKNTDGAVKYCEERGMDYELVLNPDYSGFLKDLGSCERFVFIPTSPETLSRVVVEARMMGLKVAANNLVGAVGEPWFKLKGEDLIQYMESKREEIGDLIQSVIEGQITKSNKPLVSIISTFYEAEEFLEDYLENITSQALFEQCELILIDACSPGKEREIVGRYTTTHKNIRYYRLEQKEKITPCLNSAIKRAKADFVTFAFVDDVKREGCIEALYNELIQEPTIDLVYGDVALVSEKNLKFQRHHNEADLFDHSRYEFSKENMVKCLPGPMPLWRKSLHEKIGFFDPKQNYADDWEMWLRAVNTGSRFKKVNEIVGLYYTGGRSYQEGEEESNLEQRTEEATLFFKYKHLFGYNFYKFQNYFNQYLMREVNSE